MLSLNVSSNRVEKWIGWKAPSRPYFKLNADGSHINTGLASAGGLLRNYTGRWVSGFGINVGLCFTTSAELWGFYNDLLLAWNYGVQLFEVEVLSRCVTQLITSQSVSS